MAVNVDVVCINNITDALRQMMPACFRLRRDVWQYVNVSSSIPAVRCARWHLLSACTAGTAKSLPTFTIFPFSIHTLSIL
ncbi:MAG: hypothetical protein IPL35_05710 [Sphingobacteriales bacterium]|nr:hypothetical protein [Sphingobacteriales bacterium]